ncbi:MAG TPA: glycosyltransferase [Sedimentisphaerales bacterium]|nr:glycosyltransferase [Sedimentisphaerales bacterium]
MISVVIPSFNAGGFIKRTIDSVLEQIYCDYELIVVDDGSTDNTAEVVKSYGAKVRYIYQQNAGDGPARNAGIKAAKGEWIAFLDHDDEWLPEKLQLQMELLGRHPDLRWCGSNRYQSDGARRTVVADVEAVRTALTEGDYFEDYFKAAAKGACPVITSTMVVHREAFELAGVFDSCWPRAADLDMWWRIAYHFPKMGCLPQPLVVVHSGLQDRRSTALRLESKRGEEARRLIARHLELAKEHGRLEEFKPLAGRELRITLITTVYHGFKADARATVRQFRDFFPWYWRAATYLLTIFPEVTSAAAKTVAYLRYKLGLEREISRRWVRSEQAPGEGKT